MKVEGLSASKSSISFYKCNHLFSNCSIEYTAINRKRCSIKNVSPGETRVGSGFGGRSIDCPPNISKDLIK